jgi:hypothetical protein
MGLFDTVKQKANALASDAERAGKVTAAQARTVVLQNDIRKAERELGHIAFGLLENGAIAHADLDGAAARLRAARQALGDKEAEISRLRHAPDASGESPSAPAGAEAEAGGPVDPGVATPAAEGTAEPLAQADVPPAIVDEPTAKPRAAAKKPAAAKKAAPAKKALPARKAAPKKPPAAGD